VLLVEHVVVVYWLPEVGLIGVQDMTGVGPVTAVVQVVVV
jgi:hypothetical protein